MVEGEVERPDMKWVGISNGSCGFQFAKVLKNRACGRELIHWVTFR